MKKEDTWAPRCHFCNKFLSYRMLKSAVGWTPYGDATMTEPPDEEFAHPLCWEKADTSQRDLIRGIAWAKPSARGVLI